VGISIGDVIAVAVVEDRTGNVEVDSTVDDDPGDDDIGEIGTGVVVKLDTSENEDEFEGDIGEYERIDKGDTSPRELGESLICEKRIKLSIFAVLSMLSGKTVAMSKTFPTFFIEEVTEENEEGGETV
jgi:hypothetical protein